MKKSFIKKMMAALFVVIALVAVSATSVMATVAYLTSSAAVSNVFTIGKVGITMDEAKVGTDGKKITGEGAQRVDTNTYHLVPNTTYDKDPTIHVNAGSEQSYIFVIVRNDIESIECTNHTEHKTIAQQLSDNGWAKYTYAASGWVYVYVGFDTNSASNAPSDDVSRTHTEYPSYVYGGAGAFVQAGDYKLFDNFTIAPNANVDAFGGAKVTLTAYAIQGSGFATLADAWAAVVQTYPYIHTGTTPPASQG